MTGCLPTDPCKVHGDISFLPNEIQDGISLCLGFKSLKVHLMTISTIEEQEGQKSETRWATGTQQDSSTLIQC